MTMLRRLAVRGIALCCATAQSTKVQCWGEAMLGELDFVESDWGCACLLGRWGVRLALLRYSVTHQLRKTIEKAGLPESPGLLLKDWRKKAIGILSGLVICKRCLNCPVYSVSSM